MIRLDDGDGDEDSLINRTRLKLVLTKRGGCKINGSLNRIGTPMYRLLNLYRRVTWGNQGRARSEGHARLGLAGISFLGQSSIFCASLLLLLTTRVLSRPNGTSIAF